MNGVAQNSNLEGNLSSLQYELSQFFASVESYNLPADDPLVEMQKAIAEIAKIKDAIPDTVVQSLDLVTTRIKTQTDLNQRSFLESLAQTQGQISAMDERLNLVLTQVRKINRPSSVSKDWQSWTILGCGFLSLTLIGFNTHILRNNTPLSGDAGQLTATLVPRNPQLQERCRPLSAKEKAKLGKNFSATKICSVFL
jgi:hypothetical protein